MPCRARCSRMRARWSTCTQGQTVGRWIGKLPPVCTQFSTIIPTPLRISVPTEPDSCSLRSFRKCEGMFQRRHQCFGNRCRFAIPRCSRIAPGKSYGHLASWSRAFAIDRTTITTFAASFISIPRWFNRRLYPCFHRWAQPPAVTIPASLRQFSTFDD